MPTTNSELEHKIFDSEYFTATQCNLYIGDVLIDEITSLQIQVQQAKMPIHGYADQLFAKVAKGTVSVQGSFTINFKESGYIHTVLERYINQNAARTKFKSPYMAASSADLRHKVQTRQGGAKRDGSRGLLKRQNIEQINESIKGAVNGKTPDGREARPEELIEYYRSLSGFNNTKGLDSALARNGEGLNDNQFHSLEITESIFEAFEDKIWGPKNLDSDLEGRRGDSNKYDNIVMYITCGDYNKSDYINHTAKRIDGVHLLGQAQTIELDGRPLQESYSFVARNFV
jgi:hypothetical protein